MIMLSVYLPSLSKAGRYILGGMRRRICRTNNAGNIWAGNRDIPDERPNVQLFNKNTMVAIMTLDDIKKIDKTKCQKFSVFARDKLPMPGTKKFMNDILNREITVTDFRITGSKKRNGTDCLQLQFVMGDDVCVVFTGSSVLIDQIQSARENMPFSATVVKIDKYYSFS